MTYGADINVEAGQPLPLRDALIAVLGNALVYYDFLVYFLFADQIAKCAFPVTSGTSRVLMSIGMFGAGYVARPFGAMVIGAWGDRFGRRPTLAISFLVMGAATVGFAMTPSYSAIGIAAPLLMTFFRLLQGCGLGGDVGPLIAYAIEAAPPARRGLYGSLLYASVRLAILFEYAVGGILASLLTAQQLDSWGWRVAFLIGACIIPLGLYFRRGVAETYAAGRSPVGAHWFAPYRSVVRLAVLGFFMLSGVTAATYLFDFLASYASTVLHMPSRDSVTTIVLVTAVMMVTNVVSGDLSDRFGRKPVMAVCWFLLLICFAPGVYLVSIVRTPQILFATSFFLSFLLGMSAAPILVAFTESTPRHLRAATVSVVYGLAMLVYGLVDEFIVKRLIVETEYPLLQLWFGMGVMVLAMAAIILIRESGPKRYAR